MYLLIQRTSASFDIKTIDYIGTASEIVNYFIHTPYAWMKSGFFIKYLIVTVFIIIPKADSSFTIVAEQLNLPHATS